MALSPEILTDVMSNHLNLREVTLLARQDRQYQRGLDYLRNQAIRQVAAEHQVKTLIGIFKTYATQPDKYHLALQAYRELLDRGRQQNSVTAKTFLYPHLLLQIGLDIADASVVAKGLTSLNLDIHSPLLYQVYLLSTQDEFFRKRLIELLPQRNDLVFFRQAIRPDSGIGRFLATRDFNQIRGYSLGQKLYQFFIDFEQDWVWATLPPGSFKWYTSAPVNADLLTRRYLGVTGVTGGGVIHTQAAILATLSILSNETYLLLLLDLNPALAWYQDDTLLNNIKLTGRQLQLTTLLEYGLADGWDIVSLLRTIMPSLVALERIRQNKNLAMSLEVNKNLPSFVDHSDQISVIVDLSWFLDFKALTKAIMTAPATAPNVRIPLLITLGSKIRALGQLSLGVRLGLPRLSTQLNREPQLVDLTVELADLVITGSDLMTVIVSGYTTYQNSDFADLLMWYRPDFGNSGTTGAVTSLINFINWYINKVDGDDVINPVVFLIGGYYGFEWPAGVFWNSFSSTALASYCFRKFYNKIDLSSFYQVLNGVEGFGGIEIEVLRRRYNLVEV